MKRNPLISVCVVMYKNAEILIQTLDSIKNQTYKNIELIISDDGSDSSDLDIICSWINFNKKQFKECKFLTTTSNQGVTKNCNKCINNSNGELIKLIGDDILEPMYLEKCVNFFLDYSECKILFTKMDFLSEEGCLYKQKPFDYEFLKKNKEEQNSEIKRIIYSGIPQLPTPSMICKKEIFDLVGKYDERIPMWEDGPFYIKLIENKIKMYLLEEILVHYRLLNNSLSNGIPPKMQISVAKMYFYYFLPIEIKQRFIHSLYHILKYSIFLLFPRFEKLSPCYNKNKK